LHPSLFGQGADFDRCQLAFKVLQVQKLHNQSHETYLLYNFSFDNCLNLIQQILTGQTLFYGQEIDFARCQLAFTVLLQVQNDGVIKVT